MKFKGPRFPSFDNQQTPAPKKQWVSHSGRQSRLRMLRHSLHKILHSEAEKSVVQKVRDFIPSGPYAEFGVLMILFQAKELADSVELTFAEAVDYVLENVKIEPLPETKPEIETETETEVKSEGDQNG